MPLNIRFGLLLAIGAGLGFGVGFAVFFAVGDVGQAFEQFLGRAIMAFDNHVPAVAAMDLGVQHEAVAMGAIGAGLEVLVAYVTMHEGRFRRRHGVAAGTIGVFGHFLPARRTGRHGFSARRFFLLLATHRRERRRDHE